MIASFFTEKIINSIVNKIRYKRQEFHPATQKHEIQERGEMVLPRTGELETPTGGLCTRAARTSDDGVVVLAVMVAIFLQFGRNLSQD